MNKLKGFIYLRDNIWYQKENVIKMGISSSIIDRNNTYITGEVKRGEYIYVIEIPLEKMIIIDKCLKLYFKMYNIYKGGGTEFYDRCLINFIELYIQKLNIEYKILTKEEILMINRCEKIRNIPNVIKMFNKKRIKPNEHQQYVLEIIENFYKINNIGKIIWSCGLGKTLLSILIIKLLKFKSILFGVPNINLQKQIYKEILKVFPKSDILFIGGDDSSLSSIDIFLKSTTEPKFIISTYHSCYLLIDVPFDLKIGDEAHHLVGKKGFCIFHKIISLKTLFMTATEKIIDEGIYSMDDEMIFGKYIDTKSVHWAIENKKITDYNILVLKNNEVINDEIYMSCCMCLKSFEKYSDLTHILLYTNTTEDAELAKKYIDEISSSISKDKIYNNCIHSRNCNDLDKEINKFKQSQYGIISCVYIFGEGFDLPKLNCVCVAGNMFSEIRIVQYLLRPNRLDINHPFKKAYIIIPYINTNDWKDNNKSYEKVRNIISQMRNVDESIEQKIYAYDLNKQKSKNDKTIDYEFEEYKNELILKLRYSKALNSKFTEEQDEYNYVKSINKQLNIKSKKEYNESKYRHCNFINLPEDYFKLKGVWNSWYDFMGICIDKLIQSKDEWINFCKEKNIKSLNEYYSACEIYDNLPKEPADFYKDFTNIPIELGFNNDRRFC